MKKKFLLTLVAFVCALCCALGLAACDNGKPTPKVSSLYCTDGVNNDYTGLTYYSIYIEYGANLDLTQYKLFLHYSDGSNKEIARTDEKLSVKYYYYNSTGDQEITALPNDKIKGSYTIEYVYDGNADLKAQVRINVDRSKSGAFTVQPLGGTTWQSFGAIHNVIVKNPKGASVNKEWIFDDNGGSLKPIEKNDDTDGHYDLYLFKKSVYDGFTEEQKKDYDFLYEYYSTNYNTSEPNVYNYMPEFNDIIGVPQGEYMLLALINETYNYWYCATPAVQITVTPPSGQ